MSRPPDDRNHRRMIVTAVVFFLLCTTSLSAVDVPPEHPVYTFLNRCEACGFTNRQLSASLPYSRSTVAALLNEIAPHRSDLSAPEQQQLDYFLHQFDDRQAGGSVASRRLVYRNRRDLATLSGDRWAVFINPVVRFGVQIRRSSVDSLTGEWREWASGGEIRGTIQQFGFSARATDTHVSGDSWLTDSNSYPYRYGLRTNGFDFDEAEAEVTWESRHLELLIGKTRNRWGSGWLNVLNLSDRPTSYTQVRARVKLGPLELVTLQAKLQQKPPVITKVDTTEDGVPRLHYAEKYLAAHRIEWNIGQNLQAGIVEAVMYGERNFDVDYLTPILFLRSAEHYTGDRDNALLGADMKWRFHRNTLLYGELLVDDVTTTKLGTGWYGNKFGFLGGLRWYDPLAISRTRVIFEYLRIEPYTYSHKFAINNYQHYGTLLGASLDSNSEAVAAGFAWTATRSLEIQAWSQYSRHGANPASGRNVGGDFTRPWAPGDATTVRFLDGDLETSVTGGVQGDIEVLYDLHLTMAFEFASRLLQPENESRSKTTEFITRFGVLWHPW